jgi:hypothetical protein
LITLITSGFLLFAQSVWAVVIMADWITMEPLYTNQWLSSVNCLQESSVIGEKVAKAETIVNNIKYKLSDKYGYLADEIDELVTGKENELSQATTTKTRVELSLYVRKFKLLKKSFIISDIYRQAYYDERLYTAPTVEASYSRVYADLASYQAKLDQMTVDKKLLEEGYGLASLKAEIENYVEINNTMKEIGCGEGYIYDECKMECVEEVVCTDWVYTNWSPCVKGQQSRAIISASPQGCLGGNPVLSQACQVNIVKDNTVKEEKKLITQVDFYLTQRLAGKILLQVEKNGEGWYVYPDDHKKYYLGRPADAFNIMRNLGLGATHEFITSHSFYPDHVLGKILLDVEDKGKAYYIYPLDRKAYFLGRPEDAFTVMRDLGLGITNSDIRKIDVGETK